MIRLLLDENVSPALVTKLGEHGVLAQAVPHIGLSGRPDHEIWRYALDHDFTVVTTNARDFIRLLNVEFHPGLIVLRQSGLTRQEQWDALLPVVKHVQGLGDEDFLLNKLLEIIGPGEWQIRTIPTS